MQNKQTFSVSELVAKYINTKDDLKVALVQDAINSGISYFGTEYGTGEELLAHLYKDVADDSMNPEVWMTLRQYEQDYNIVALNDDEYNFLKSHFSETVEFIMQNHAYTPIMEVGTLPIPVVNFAIKYLGIRDGEKVYLPNAGYGDAVMLLRNKEVSGFINGRFAWSLAQVRFYAAGISADIECLDISANKEGKFPNLPKNGSVDYIISVYNNARMMPELCRHVDATDYIKCLSANGKAFLLTDGWFLSSTSASDIIKKSVSVIQFPEILTETDGEVHGSLCGICICRDSRASIDVIDLRATTCQGKKLRVFDLDVTKALSLIEEDSDFVKHLDRSKMDKDISLPVYYFVNRPRIGHSIDMVMKLVDFREAALDENLPVVTSSDLSDDFSHSSIDVDELETISKVKSPWENDDFRLVTEPCILLSVSQLEVKSGFISEIPDNGLAIPSSLFTIKPEANVSFETAVLLLQSDYVKEQLSALTHSLHGNNANKYFSKVIVWPEVYNEELDEELLIEGLQAQAEMEEVTEVALNDEIHAQAANEDLHDRMLQEEIKAQLAYEYDCKEAERRVILSSIPTSSGNSLSMNAPEDIDDSLSMNGPEDIEDSCCIESLVYPEDDCIYMPGECTFEELINALHVTEEERKELLELADKGIKEQKQSMQTNLVDSVEKLRGENKKLRESYDKKLSDSKAAYINEVRMRKHDMRPHLRQIASTERLLSHYLEQDSDIDTMKQHLRNQITRIHDAVKHLSDLVEHLSDEDKFGTPERFNIDKYLNDLSDGDFFTIDYDCDEEMLVQAGFGCHKSHTFINDYFRRKEEGEDLNVVNELLKLKEGSIRLDTYIAPLDFERLVQNIIENAKRHGFTDPTRENYNIGIYLTINRERGMYQIDFSNNGNPFPEGMTKDRFGIRGEKAGLTGGTGQGGHIIKSIVEHYGGDYEIFQDEASAVVRIYLPIMR